MIGRILLILILLLAFFWFMLEVYQSWVTRKLRKKYAKQNVPEELPPLPEFNKIEPAEVISKSITIPEPEVPKEPPKPSYPFQVYKEDPKPQLEIMEEKPTKKKVAKKK